MQKIFDYPYTVDYNFIKPYDKLQVKIFINNNKDLLNKDLYTFVYQAYNNFYSDSNSFNYLKHLLLEAGLDWNKEEPVKVNDTVEIIDPGARYSSYLEFFPKNNLDKYLKLYKQGYNVRNRDLIGKQAKVLYIRKPVKDSYDTIYLLELVNDATAVFLFGREGFAKHK